LIGVLPKAGQSVVVEEFFQLFKTPWEFCRPGRTYDVVIATTDRVPEVNARLLLVYGLAPNNQDSRSQTNGSRRPATRILGVGDRSLPIYCGLSTFAGKEQQAVCLTADSEVAGFSAKSSATTVLCLGYDLFEEVRFLLSAGQPIKHAQTPTLDMHIEMLRNWILRENISLLEILPAPAGHKFAVCLTHDIDFIGIRNHKFDHTMWGFVYRATIGSLHNFFRGRLTPRLVLRNWRAVASLPFVYLGWANDFWEPFDWYLNVEKDLPSTYFVVPFKGRSGEKVSGRKGARRAVAYEASDHAQSLALAQRAGCEIGVHGIDAWHSVELGRNERNRISEITGEPATGIRMHWLLQDANTALVLEDGGYAYDSTVGYNETIGYRAGTSQVFRPLNAKVLLELPVQIQDGALFYPQRLDLSDSGAEKLCGNLIEDVEKFGGVLTTIWHDRSHAPERLWGEFYIRLIRKLRSLDAWFDTAGRVAGWFGRRRQVRFEQIETCDGLRTTLRYDGPQIQPPLNVRFYSEPTYPAADNQPAAGFVDIPWDGKSAPDLETQLGLHALPGIPDRTFSLTL